MSKLIILRGNSGSGKTSVAKALQDKLGPNTMLLSHDMIRMQILHVWGQEGKEKSLPLMVNLLKYGRQHSAVTILEGILDSVQYHGLFQTALEEYGANIFAYFYELSFEETLRRHRTKLNRFDFGETEMRRWWRERDYLTIITETVLKEDLSLEDAVEMIYRRVTAGSLGETT